MEESSLLAPGPLIPVLHSAFVRAECSLPIFSVDQGLTALAIDCRPFGDELRRTGNIEQATAKAEGTDCSIGLGLPSHFTIA